MDAKGVRNMYSILVVFNKHNTARAASCWFIIYYRSDILVLHFCFEVYVYSVAELGLQSQFGHGIVQCTTDLEHLYRIYSIPTHDKHQWLLLQFIVLLMMDEKGVRNM